MQIHKDIIQGSDEWRKLRNGRMTASHAQEIGNGGKGLETYVYKLLAEAYSSAEPESYMNENMLRGKELEAQARAMYELEYNQKVEQVGLIEQDEYVSVSPDGLIGEAGGIEIKCHDDVNHFKLILNGQDEIETKYLWQIQMNLLVTERNYWFYLAYNPNFEKSLLVFRIEPNAPIGKCADPFEALKKGIEKGKDLIDKIKSKL